MCRLSAAVAVVLLCSSMICAQTSPAPAGFTDEDRGLASYVQFGGSANSSGRVFKLDAAVGYNFSSHVGFDVGALVYFVTSSTNTGVQNSNNGIGNPYLDFRFTFRHPALSYRSIVTGYFPLADVKSGFSTGRMTGDWTNHFERSFSRLTPFADIGIGNTIRDSRFFNRPFTSLGLNTHFEGGASVALSEHVDIGASGYAIVPSGQQRIYSKLLRASTGHNMGHGRVFDTTTETVGTADIARDHGFSAWIGASPNEYLDMELGYTRSAAYDLNTVSFGVGVNIGRLVRKRNH